MKKQQPITVIINTYPHADRTEDLNRTLTSLKKQTYSDFSILLIENSVDNGEVRILTKKYAGYYPIKVLVDPTKRLSYLFNLGWKNAKTEYLAYLADDAAADAHWLAEIERELTENENIAAVSGPVVSTNYPAGEMHRLYLVTQSNRLLSALSWPYFHFVMEDRPLAPGRLFQSGAYSLGAGLRESLLFPRQEIDLLTTTSMGIRRSAILKVGGFDECFMFNHADGDLFLKLKSKGFRLVFNPKVIVRHHLRLGPSRNPEIIGRDTAVFYKRHLRPRSISGIIGAMMNLIFLNSYWVYSAVRNNSFAQLRGLTGFIRGLKE